MRRHRRPRAARLLIVCLLATLALGGLDAAAAGSVAAANTDLPTARHERVVATVERLLGGIPESGNALGYRDAPVTLQVFGDLECPVCREFALGALRGLIEHDVRDRRLRIEARSLETATREPEVFARQQVAALAAGRQGRMWYFNEIFYREQGREDSDYATNAYLRGIAQQVPGLNVYEWSAARADPALVVRLARDEQAALMRRFDGTPSFLLGRTHRRLRRFGPSTLVNPAPYEAAVQRLLKRR